MERGAVRHRDISYPRQQRGLYLIYMSGFELVILTFVALYCLQSMVLYVGSGRLNYEKTDCLIDATVLVALRDEAATVAECIESLLSQDYPRHKFNILLINDRSTDRTPQIIHEYAGKHENITVLEIEQRLEGMSGKASAIAQAMDIVTTDLILITDGDSVVPVNWVKTHASYYRDDVGMVGGFTLLDRKTQKVSLFSKIQSLDWLYLLSIGSGAIGIGRPLSILGNNMSYRKQAYDSVGGYRNMGFTIIEDFALMRQLVHKTEWQVRYPADKEMLVISRAMPDFAAFYEQRKRWSAGGKEVGWYGKFLMLVSFLSHLLLTAAWFLTPGLQTVVLTLLVLAVDFILLNRSAMRFDRFDLMRHFFLWEIFYFVYTSFFAPVLLLPTTVKWKDVRYKWQFDWRINRVDEETRNS